MSPLSRPVDTGALLQRLAALRQAEAQQRAVDADLAPLLRCAATLVEFDPPALAAACGSTPEPALLARLFRHAEAVRRDPTEPEADTPPPGPWRLRPAERQRAVREAGSAQALRQARARLPGPALLAQRMADALLAGTLPDPKGLPIGELAALIDVRPWYEGVLPGLPEEAQLRRHMALAQLLDPLRRLVGAHFVGRTGELARLADYVGILGAQTLAGSSLLGLGLRYLRQVRRSLTDNPPLFVSGPGGVGKSSLLARFILDHVDAPEGADMPFVMLDFDRAQVESRLPLSLLVAALAQLRAQFPAHDAAMARMAEHLVQLMRGSDAAELSKLDSLQGRLVEDFAQQVDSMLGGEHNPAPLLWVLDTFEEPQRLGDSTVGPLWELMNSLQQQLPRLRLVVCGRAVPPGFAWDVVPLDEFDELSAVAFLRHRVLAADPQAQVDNRTLAQVIKVVNRTPLALRLAARLLAEQDHRLLNLKLRRENIQAVLFHRVLEHIRVAPQLESRQGATVVDDTERRLLEQELGKLVFPGLAVRRITPGVIAQVLALPCGVKLRDEGHAQRLFSALAQQVDIVEPAEDDGLGPSLLHRTDVRRMMLRDLEEKAGPELIRRIDQRAVSYHAGIATLANCAEEIYHRLRLQQTEATIRARWEPGLEPYLLPALEEIAAPAMRVMLAELLGVTLDSAALEGAEHDAWERQAARRVREYLRAGNPARALAVLAERSQRAQASPLLRLQAQALQQQADFGPAAGLAERALDEAAQVGDFAAAADAALLLSLSQEAMGALEPASQQVQQALDWTAELDDRPLRLRTLAAALRLARKRGDAAAAQQQAQAISTLLNGDTLRRLRFRPALLRDLLAEMGSRDERLLRQGLDTLGVDLPSEAAAAQLAQALHAWTATALSPENLRDLVQAQQLAPPEAQGQPDVQDWQNWLWSAAPREVGQLLLRALKLARPDEIVLRELAELFRIDVDRRIMRGQRQRAV